MLQRAPLIWKVHGGDPLQDLVQFLLAGGLWAQMGREEAQRETELMEHWPWEQPHKAAHTQGRDVPTATELVGGTRDF